MGVQEHRKDFLGKSFDDKFEEVLVTLDGYGFTKDDAINVLGCGNFSAARRLSDVLKKLKVKTSTQLFKLGPDSLARVRGVGHATLYVAMCLLDYSGKSVERWWGWNKDPVTFSTHKARAFKKAKRRTQDV